MSDSAIVLFSGGQDSTVCLAWALERFAHVETIGFQYGQRHAIELAVRLPIRAKMAALRETWRTRLGDDFLLSLDALGEISNSALTRDTAIEIAGDGLPTTFVPGRNLIFLSYAAALGYRRGITDLVGGMCETDYSGYPDCRNATIKVMGQALSLGLDRPVTVHTPLMALDKAATFALAQEIGGNSLLDLVIEETHSCYCGDRSQRHDWGYGCGTCPACELRQRGFAKFKTGMQDR